MHGILSLSHVPQKVVVVSPLKVVESYARVQCSLGIVIFFFNCKHVDILPL